MAKGARRLTAVVRKIDAFDALELRYAMDGRFLESQMYRGEEIAKLKPDAGRSAPSWRRAAGRRKAHVADRKTGVVFVKETHGRLGAVDYSLGSEGRGTIWTLPSRTDAAGILKAQGKHARLAMKLGERPDDDRWVDLVISDAKPGNDRWELRFQIIGAPYRSADTPWPM
jgi:hypothetical protein